ncbi:tyrosine-type recombinase/integrase [Leifsonia sp. PS1209]|uniref:tyrosine-type recombinase/integrase n=1 Tax=Leifsonia sp. PS1209 TaxID=2724914 RepID=UPI001442BF2C|nr:tyrosine-type recombinase/integrase [Leifsonia sp. PS1209]QIZ99849.1 site-specific integrase [Leifsonia sp. PS1209]
MGSVHPYETAGGKRYRVQYRTPERDLTGKRGFRTKRDAELFLASVEVAKARGEFVDARASRSTISTLGTEWLANQHHLKPSSLRPVEIAWRLHVEPKWGNRHVGEIRHSEVQNWVTAFTKGEDRPRSATTVLRAYGVLAGILDTAVMDRRIPSNPARGVNLPRKLKGKHKYLTHSQVDLLANKAKKHKPLVLFLAYTGLRWGEATALRVRDIDLSRRRVDVHENAVEVSGTIHVGTPKTGESRSVPFPPFLVPLLEALSETKTPSQLLFGDGISYLHQPDRRRGWYVSAIARSQAADPEFPRVTIHDLRHTAASLAISAGANVKAVQRMLGHSSAAMTLDTYADLFDDDLDSVAVALDAARDRAIMSAGR